MGKEARTPIEAEKKEGGRRRSTHASLFYSNTFCIALACKDQKPPVSTAPTAKAVGRFHRSTRDGTALTCQSQVGVAIWPQIIFQMHPPPPARSGISGL